MPSSTPTPSTSATGYRDPRVAQTVLQLVLAAYIDHHISVFQDPGEQVLLRSQLDQSVSQYQDRLNQLSAYMVAHHVYTGDAQVDSMIDQGEKLDQSYSEASATMMPRPLASSSSAPSATPWRSTSATAPPRCATKSVKTSPPKLNVELVQEQNVLNLHPKGSRAYQDEQARLDRLRELIKDLPDRVVDQTEQRRSPASTLVDSYIVDATSVQRADQARMQQLRTQRNLIGSQINDYATSVGGFNLLKLQTDLAKQKSEQLGHAYVDSQLKSLTSGSAITDVSIVDPPSWDWHPASPKSSVVAIAAIGLLLVGSVAVILVGIALDDTFLDSRIAAEALHTPVTATFPFLPQDPGHDGSPDLLTGRSEQEFARLYQAVRHDDPQGHVILVVHPPPAAAPASSAIISPASLGRMSGRQTSFIDCTEHAINPSSTSVADGPSIQSWPAPSLDKPGAQSEALASLTSWRQQFPYTVIAADADQAPVNLLSSSHMVNDTFLVLQANKSRRGDALQEVDLLRTCGFPKIKLILNQFKSFTPSWLARFV